MKKLITGVKIGNNLHLVSQGTYYYLFIFGWIGYIKYRFRRILYLGVKYSMLQIYGHISFFNLYLKLIDNFYNWTTVFNKRVLVLKGVGFKYRLLQNALFLVLGYSHIIKLDLCRGILVELINNKTLDLYSINACLLNKYVYKIKGFKKLDIYKGKGILFHNERVTKKEGKKASF